MKKRKTSNSYIKAAARKARLTLERVPNQFGKRVWIVKGKAGEYASLSELNDHLKLTE